MKVQNSAAVLGLVPVPPMPAGGNWTDSSQHQHASSSRVPPDGPKCAAHFCLSPCGKWGRAAGRLSLALNGLFAIALAVGPTAASSYCAHKVPAPIHPLSGDVTHDIGMTRYRNGKPLRPVTFGMRPVPTTKVAAFTPPNLNSGSPGPTSDVVIDVIVAYTKKAAGHYADIKHDLVELAIEEANESFRRSNLGHIKLRLVHTYQTDYVEEGMHFDHVWRFADKGDGYMDEIHGLRDQYRADVAVLVVDDAQGCGLATRVQADVEEAFAVVHHECTAKSYSLAHEIGHLIGARHDLGYVNGTKWRDIMSYKDACGGCPRLAVWSSPTVLVNGEPAGTVQLNNARIIAEQAARVAAFR
jgi:hypothetical protein